MTISIGQTTATTVDVDHRKSWPASDEIIANVVLPSNETSKQSQKGELTAVLVSGVGFLADAYDLFVIDFVVAILAAIAVEAPSAGSKSLVGSATLAGAVVGQLGFGIAADFIGRRVMFLSTAALVILGAITSATLGLGYTLTNSSFTIFHQLAIARFMMGIGIGGEYPLSATVASESSDYDADAIAAPAKRTGCWRLKHPPNSIAAVFSMQGVGMLLSPVFVIICISSGLSLEATWRVCLSFGAFPSSIAFYFRWRMHETADFKKMQRENLLADRLTESERQQAAALRAPPQSQLASKPTEDVMTNVDPNYSSLLPQSHFRKLSDWLSKSVSSSANVPYNSLVTSKIKKNSSMTGKEISCWTAFGDHLKYSWKTLKLYKTCLIGTALCWLLIDISLYGTGSFKSAIIRNMFTNTNSTLQSNIAMNYASPDGLTKRLLQFDDTPQQRQRDTVKAILSGLGYRKVYATTTSDQQEYNLRRSPQWRTTQFQEIRRDLLNQDVQSSKDKIFMEAQLSIIVALLAIPGYFLSVIFIHQTGLKGLQLWGFVVVATVFFVLGAEQLLHFDMKVLELILFGLTFLCSNFGPNTTTFILPTQIYPTIVRATCHGFSAAMGKLGGVFGASMFTVIEERFGLAYFLILCGFAGLSGAIVTYYFIPSDEAYAKCNKTSEIPKLDVNETLQI